MAKISCEVSDGRRTVVIDAPDMIEFDNSKVKNPWHVPPISELFSTLIGKSLFVWADFENEFDLFVEGLVNATGYTNPRAWNGQNFKNRAKLFQEMGEGYFGPASTILRYMNLIRGKAAKLQESRNHLAHGRLNCELEVVGKDLDDLKIKTTLMVYMRRTGKKIRYSPAELEKFYYAMAHLSGLMHRLSSLDTPPSAISSLDRPALQAFLQKHHPRSKEQT